MGNGGETELKSVVLLVRRAPYQWVMLDKNFKLVGKVGRLASRQWVFASEVCFMLVDTYEVTGSCQCIL